MNKLITASLLVGAFIHLLPLSGALGQRSLSKLYGLTIPDRNIEILIRHRAILFGLLGIFLAFAAFDASLQVAAFIAGIVSTGSFLVLARRVGEYNTQLSRVVRADRAVLMALLIGALASVLAHDM